MEMSERVERLQVMLAEKPGVPSWVRPGAPVWYSPHRIPGARRYLGMIGSEPRALGGHTLVVRLDRMERAYGRDGVAAAAVDALEPVSG